MNIAGRPPRYRPEIDRFPSPGKGYAGPVARNERYIPVPPGTVFDVLADPRQYGYVVFGSKNIRQWDRTWPKERAEFHHTIGYGPVNVKDRTEVVAVDPPRRLELIARGRPLGKARVTFELKGAGGGTDVTMVEDPLIPKAVHMMLPAFHAFTRLRNRTTLRRLSELAGKAPAERERIGNKQAAGTAG
jgi:uncharacterized protein YndB with AHSA1/START domain